MLMQPLRVAWFLGGLGVLMTFGCEEKPQEQEPQLLVVPPLPMPSTPRLLYIPDGGDIAPPEAPPIQLPGSEPVQPPLARPSGNCPGEMVNIAGEFCIDRYEVQLVDTAQGRVLSPYYAPEARRAKREHGAWRKLALEMGSQSARAMPLPLLPGWQQTESYEFKAISQPNVVPHGYMNWHDAQHACESAGKRLCFEAEWVKACQGEERRQFPYGDKYEWNKCNVFREAHPAHELHDDASKGHLDPRLNQVRAKAGPLLRNTGATAECKSRWGADAVHDMVGNLDEWVADGDGVFLGGFFSRSTKKGCLSRISSHAPEYYDYSLGTRCCAPL